MLDLDRLLDDLTADAAGAIREPTTRAALVDAAIQSFNEVDADENGENGGVLFQAVRTPPSGSGGTSGSGSSGESPCAWAAAAGQDPRAKHGLGRQQRQMYIRTVGEADPENARFDSNTRVSILSDWWEQGWVPVPGTSAISNIGSNEQLIQALEQRVKATGVKIKELNICGHGSSYGGVRYKSQDSFGPGSLTAEQVQRLQAVLDDDAVIVIWGCRQGSDTYAEAMYKLAAMLKRGVWATPLMTAQPFEGVEDTSAMPWYARLYYEIVPGRWTGQWKYFSPDGPPPPWPAPNSGLDGMFWFGV
jgi:hypothetical protein